MGNKKSKLDAGESLGITRRHYCPECPASEDGKLSAMRPVLKLPRRRIEFRCPNGHSARKGATILR
jgi:hypothetical protein